jgi:hypothetical protein
MFRKVVKIEVKNEKIEKILVKSFKILNFNKKFINIEFDFNLFLNLSVYVTIRHS